MNFFEHQDRARKRTGRLVILFGVAVIMLVFAIYGVIAAAVMWSQSRSSGPAFDLSAMDGVWLGGWFPWHPGLFLVVTVGTLAVIAGGSLYKTAALSSGGRRVAETLGGRLIPLDTVELHERRVLNVVEEMALASGVPVPPVYLLPQERGINAFAAGFSPSDAVVGVTRGCIETLSRDELQGVVAHEFSHILNGDMRLNLRLIGLLHGILLIALIGSILMRSGYISRSNRSSNRKNANYLPLIGLVLYVLGYIGVFFGHLIKSSVSRQREFLADASAVQFTRNPEGIAGALARILQSTTGSKLDTPKVEEASHLLFSNGLSASWMEAFSTHPPLPKRIQQIDPGFSIPEYLKRRAAGAEAGSGAVAARARVEGRRQRTVSSQPVAAAMVAGLAEASAGSPQQPTSAPPPPPERKPQAPAASPADDVAERFVQSLGQPTDAHLQQAAAWRNRLPAALLDQLHTPAGAVAVTYCLFLDAHTEAREKQAAYLRQHALPGALAEAQRWWPSVRPSLPDGRLGLVELALPALKQLSAQQCAALLQNLRSLVEMDRQVTVNEYALYTLIRLHLDRHFGRARAPGTRFMSVSSVREPAAALLSILARAGQTPLAHNRQPSPAEQAAADQAYQRAWQRMLGGKESPPPLLAATACTSQRLDGALQQLQSASSAVKQRLLTACVTSVVADRQVTVSEAELLRLVADQLDCPAPPLLSLGGA